MPPLRFSTEREEMDEEEKLVQNGTHTKRQESFKETSSSRTSDHLKKKPIKKGYTEDIVQHSGGITGASKKGAAKDKHDKA